MDLLARITTPIGSIKSGPPETKVDAPATVDAPAVAVKEKELLPPISPTIETVVVGEADLLTSPPAPLAPTPDAPPGDVSEPPKRKRGRPFGSKNPPKLTDETISPSSVPNIGDIETAAQAVTVNYQLMAEATFDVTTGVAASAIGPEWNAKNEDERQMVCKPLARYLEYKQVKDLPPNLALALVVVAYSAPRLREPGTASKLRMLWAWTKERLRALRSK